MNTIIRQFLLLTVLFACNQLSAHSTAIDLSGKWQVKLDSTNTGLNQQWQEQSFETTIQLPGTTDDAGIGFPNLLLPKLERPQVLRLTRKNSYVGPAWYTRKVNIPRNWKNKQVVLKLERVIWETRVWVDGREVNAVQESLSTPHYFDLTGYLTPGEHRLTVRVDNSKKYDISVKDMAHAYTNETQIMWNGIIGDIKLVAADKLHIDNVQVFPDIERKLVKVRLDVVNQTGKRQKAKLNLSALLSGDSEPTGTHTVSYTLNPAKTSLEVELPMGNSPQLWDEFNPALYTLTASLSNRSFASEKQVRFGMRKLTGISSALQLNNNNIFLRGTLECAIFPIKGYPPMQKSEWTQLFLTARRWGLNHLRFHSWCPPKAAFEAADELGFYLQAELPLWSLSINKDEPTNKFLYAEAENIIREYGNHPSFCFWSLGNELQPDFTFLNKMVDYLKEKDPRRLYTNTSFTFEKGHGKWPERNDDFFITQYTDKGWVRGQGVFDSESPTFNKDYSHATEGLPVPLITHEIGQYAVYPNMNEIKKYTGVLDPLNFKAVKADLEQKGLAHKANDYLMASGKLAAILYKEEIERAFKTKGVSGFQLLDLHDFPGQGTALVGLLDAFWDSKNLIEAEKFREFCGPVVPLIRFNKATYTNNELFEASTELANYGKDDLNNFRISWSISSANNILKQGQMEVGSVKSGSKKETGRFTADLSSLTSASKLKVQLWIEGTEYRNSWEIWVYPSSLQINKGSVIVTSDIKTALDELQKGKKVLLSPEPEKIKGVEGKFVQVFWSPVHFPDQPGTMGLLMNPAHPAFNHFPTEMHTNWQWWDLCKQSKTMVVDSIPGAMPIVENVDNFMKNRRLCSLFEAQSGGGSLIVSSMDLITDVENRPAARQLLFSLVEYMNSDKFNPQGTISTEAITNLLVK